MEVIAEHEIGKTEKEKTKMAANHRHYIADSLNRNRCLRIYCF